MDRGCRAGCHGRTRLISLAGATASHTRPGTWFILEAPLLAIVATALIFTGAVMRSRGLWPIAPRVQRR